MNKLASIRDGSFFYVENYKKITEYFVSVLGGCISAISQKVDLNLQILNNNCKIMKVFGEDNLYNYKYSDKYFKTSMLQFVCGKEYTFVLEILLDESKVLIGEELIDIDFTYEDITQKTINTLKKKYKYELKDLQYAKANEEYIRSQVYDVLEKALKSRESSNNEESKKLLKDMEEWLKKNYTGEHKEYLQDIVKAQKLFEDEEVFMTRGVTYVTSQIRANQSKRTSDMNYCNSIQRHYGRTAQLPHKNLNNNI
jgi:hypothetical protein